MAGIRALTPVFAATMALTAHPALADQTVWSKWLTTLGHQGYTVVQGVAHEYTQADCQTDYPVFHTCFGDDFQSSYIYAEPPAGNEYIDPYYKKAGSSVTNQGIPVSRTYRLAPEDAMIVIAQLPPQAAYFSYQSYLFTRPASFYPNGVQRLSPDPARANLFSILNNSINNVAISQQSGVSLGQGTVAFITTGNATLQANLVNSFQAVGGLPSQLFTDTVGSNINLGIDQNADELMTVIRYSGALYPNAGQRWQVNAAYNMLVYRITQPAGQGVQTYPPATIATKSFNAKESSHQATQHELSVLLQGWLAALQKQPAIITPTSSSEQVGTHGTIIAGLAGPLCISAGTYCTGDEQDTDAYKIATIGTLPARATFIIDGVDHTVTNNATYVSVAAQDAEEGVRVANAGQVNAAAAGFASGVLTGSAAQALTDLGLISQASPALIADLPNLYVHIFTRTCPKTQLYCTRSYTTLLSSQVSTTQHFEAVERAYVLPGFLNGANPSILLNPDTIH